MTFQMLPSATKEDTSYEETNAEPEKSSHNVEVTVDSLESTQTSPKEEQKKVEDRSNNQDQTMEDTSGDSHDMDGSSITGPFDWKKWRKTHLSNDELPTRSSQLKTRHSKKISNDMSLEECNPANNDAAGQEDESKAVEIMTPASPQKKLVDDMGSSTSKQEHSPMRNVEPEVEEEREGPFDWKAWARNNENLETKDK